MLSSELRREAPLRRFVGRAWKEWTPGRVEEGRNCSIQYDEIDFERSEARFNCPGEGYQRLRSTSGERRPQQSPEQKKQCARTGRPAVDPGQCGGEASLLRLEGRHLLRQSVLPALHPLEALHAPLKRVDAGPLLLEALQQDGRQLRVGEAEISVRALLDQTRKLRPHVLREEANLRGRRVARVFPKAVVMSPKANERSPAAVAR